jgi:RNA polymerase sigma factor (sigma-70 family)
MATGLSRVLQQLQQGGGPTDGQLLGRFVAGRDEAAFAALVRRHGPMVLGVCRRVLHDFHHAEDAFQATFLVLARKAASLAGGGSLGGWLHGVAYHTALRAGAALGRRRSRERPMSDVPHPSIAPPEPRDWLPLLDRELSLLPERYRAVIVACDLEGRTRKEAARLLGVSEGTLSSRLARGRTLLARRLANCGVALSGGALAVAMGEGAASAALPAALVCSTARAAALVAAGQVAGASAPAVVLMRGVMKAMLLRKLRLVVGAVVVLLALGAVGVGYQAGGGSGAAQAAPPDKPQNELEALRNENELLKLNLQVVLEKVRAQETELHAVRKDLAAAKAAPPTAPFVYNTTDWNTLLNANNSNPVLSCLPSTINSQQPFAGISTLQGLVVRDAASDPVKDAEAAVKALREAKDKEGQRKAAEALEQAMKKLKEQLK